MPYLANETSPFYWKKKKKKNFWNRKLKNVKHYTMNNLPLWNVEHVRGDWLLKVSTVHRPQTTKDTEQ